MHLYARRVRQHPEIVEQPDLDLVEVLRGVLVRHVRRTDVQLEVGSVVLKVVVVRQLCTDTSIRTALTD